MSSSMRFLLINGSQSMHWHRALESALAALGKLDAVEEKDALAFLACREYDLIFIDATAVAEASVLVRQIRGQRLTTPVIVVSAAPNWEQARKVFKAGATNYIIKSYEEEELLNAARAVLDPLASPAD